MNTYCQQNPSQLGCGGGQPGGAGGGGGGGGGRVGGAKRTPASAAAPQNGAPPEEKKESTTWACVGDVAWGIAEGTVVGTLIGLGADLAANSDERYSGRPGERQHYIRRSNLQYARIVLKGAAKATAIGAVAGAAWDGYTSYRDSKNC